MLRQRHTAAAHQFDNQQQRAATKKLLWASLSEGGDVENVAPASSCGVFGGVSRRPGGNGKLVAGDVNGPSAKRRHLVSLLQKVVCRASLMACGF